MPEDYPAHDPEHEAARAAAAAAAAAEAAAQQHVDRAFFAKVAGWEAELVGMLERQAAPLAIRQIVAVFKDRINTERDKARPGGGARAQGCCMRAQRCHACMAAPSLLLLTRDVALAAAAAPCHAPAACCVDRHIGQAEFKQLCDKWTGVVEFPAGSGTKCLAIKSWMRRRGPLDAPA